ncbi:GNAT family N-acetyltransferase [Streptomyces olindensis]|uniref:GNAT family N-acetyltransferase n=1 Tax=Streptomyces olindensis TaxID=358823 RepID=UPI0036B7BB5E
MASGAHRSSRGQSAGRPLERSGRGTRCWADAGSAERSFFARPADGSGWILSLGVARDRRGRGLGRRLMLAALHRLGSDGAVEARLAVRADDEAALGLHTSLGFVPEGDVRRDYYGPGEDRLLLRLGLEQQESGQVPGSTDTPAVAHSPGRRAAGPSCGEAGSVRRGRPGG